MSLPPPHPSGAEMQPVADKTAAQSRLFAPDVIRGFALFGMLLISVWEFGGFSTNEQLFYHQGTHGGNYNLMTAISLLFEGKMRALMALVFGAGILLFLQPTGTNFMKDRRHP